MATMATDQLLDVFKQMTVLELNEFLKAFEQVRAGSPYLSGELAMQVALVQTGVHRNPLADLTPRELQALALLAEGQPYGQIAVTLNVSYKTVANSLSLLKSRLGVANTSELIRLAIKGGYAP